MSKKVFRDVVVLVACATGLYFVVFGGIQGLGQVAIGVMLLSFIDDFCGVPK